MSKYLFRVDDVCPEMDWEKFEKLIKIFDKFNVKPLLAIIPNNQDGVLKKNPPNPNFWPRIEELKENGYMVGMHGYQHRYLNKSGGMLRLYRGSEFANLPFESQLEKIKKGKKILERHKIKTNIFVAPGHSFDRNTIKALRVAGFEYISDGIALWPFEKYGIIWVPQILWRPRKIPIGILTVCLHSNTLPETGFLKLEEFIQKNREDIIDFYQTIRWFRAQTKDHFFLINFLNFIIKPLSILLKILNSTFIKL